MHNLVYTEAFDHSKVYQVVFEGDDALNEVHFVVIINIKRLQLGTYKVEAISDLDNWNETTEELGHFLVHELFKIDRAERFDLSKNLGLSFHQSINSRSTVALDLGKLASSGE